MEFFIGQIILMPNRVIPKYFFVCDGRELIIGDNPALASVLGYNYKNLEDTFNLPTKISDVEGYSYCICYGGNYPERDENESK